jgi:transposase-like protein
MEMQQIRYFLALCEERNFTRAAGRCGVAQPSLTRAIKQLEHELGGALFLRSRSGATLTPRGAALRRHFLRIRESAAAAKREAERFSTEATVQPPRREETVMLRKMLLPLAAFALLVAIGGFVGAMFTVPGRTAPAAATIDPQDLHRGVDVKKLAEQQVVDYF